MAATTALVLAIAASPASAGVVISEDEVVSDNAGNEHKNGQIVMPQGNKKNITPNRVIITDFDGGKVYALAPSLKKRAQITLSPIKQVAMILARRGMIVGYQKSSGGAKVAGCDCENCSGSDTSGRTKIETKESVASAAAGFVAFRKVVADKLKNYLGAMRISSHDRRGTRVKSSCLPSA